MQGRPAPQGRGRGRRQHRGRPGALDALERRVSDSGVRLHALEPSLRKELEDRPPTDGRQEGDERSPLPDRARGRPRVLPGHPFERRPDALPGQQAVEDEAGHAAGQPDRRGPQWKLALHRIGGPRREQHPAVDHRERLAGSHRRPAAQHVLQHRHRHVRLGAHEPEARAPAGQSAADRRDQVVPSAQEESGEEELRTRAGGHREDLPDVPRLRGDGGEPDLRQRGVRLLEGDGRAAAPAEGGLVARALRRILRSVPATRTPTCPAKPLAALKSASRPRGSTPAAPQLFPGHR